jgi:hypothetical protein
MKVMVIAIVTGVSFALCAVAAATISTFEANTEGWTAVGDVAGPVTWLSTGGNPAGHIELTDQVIGGVTYFVAPTSFHGNYNSALGTSLTFDLRQSFPGAPNQFDAPDIILEGGGLTLLFDTPTNPANNGWTSYDVPLTDVSGWRVSNLSGPLATQAQILTTLTNITDLQIRAEYQTGADTDSLDNVFLFSAPSSIPDSSSALFMLSLAVSGLGLLRRKMPA